MYEECYEYNEDACFIADSKESARQFMMDCGHENADYKIKAISFADIMKGYGYSSGEYAMEETAFQNFKKIAEDNKVKFKAKEFHLDPTLIVVNVNDSCVVERIRSIFCSPGFSQSCHLISPRLCCFILSEMINRSI